MAHLADESGKAGLPGQQVREVSGEVREEFSSDQPRTPAGAGGGGRGGEQSLSPFLPAQQAFGIFILSTDVNWLCHLEGLTPRLGVEDSQV